MAHPERDSIPRSDPSARDEFSLTGAGQFLSRNTRRNPRLVSSAPWPRQRWRWEHALQAHVVRDLALVIESHACAMLR